MQAAFSTFKGQASEGKGMFGAGKFWQRTMKSGLFRDNSETSVPFPHVPFPHFSIRPHPPFSPLHTPPAAKGKGKGNMPGNAPH